MKKLISFIAIICFVSVNAQQAKAIAKTSSSTSYSNVSVSVSDSDDLYSYAASFDKINTKKAISEIENVFGKGIKEGNNLVWKEGDIFEIKARDGRISIAFEKGSSDQYEKIKKLGDKISQVIGTK